MREGNVFLTDVLITLTTAIVILTVVVVVRIRNKYLSLPDNKKNQLKQLINSI